MADEKGAEPKKGGFFSRKKEEPKQAAPPAPAAKPGAPAAAPGKPPVAQPPGAKPGAPVKPGAGPAPTKPAQPADLYEPRFSFDTVPEIERRIDRMEVHKYASLQQLFESKYGEKLEVPTVFVSLDGDVQEGQKEGEAKPIDPAKLAALDAKIAAATEIPSKPGAPVAPGAVPVKPGAVPVKPGAAPVKPGAVRPPPGTVQARPVAVPVTPGAPAAPAKPSPINGSSFWKYFWCPWRLPFRALGKIKYPGQSGKIIGMTVLDVLIYIPLTIVRLLGPLYVGAILESSAKKRAAGAAKKDSAAVAVD